MNIKTRYNIGDTVLVKADPILRTTCPFCQGKGSLEVGGTDLYCQNCEGDGVLESRMMDHRQWVEGVITGMAIDIRPIAEDEDGYTDEDYVVDDTGMGIAEDYLVKVDNNYWGDGTYNVRKIKDKDGDNNEQNNSDNG